MLASNYSACQGITIRRVVTKANNAINSQRRETAHRPSQERPDLRLPFSGQVLVGVG
jgi:hypothetical protein